MEKEKKQDERKQDEKMDMQAAPFQDTKIRLTENGGMTPPLQRDTCFDLARRFFTSTRCISMYVLSVSALKKCMVKPFKRMV